MKAHETPPMDQTEWDTFLTEAKSNIDTRTVARATRTPTRQRRVRWALSAVTVSGLALSATVFLDGPDPQHDLRAPAVRATGAPSTPSVDIPQYTAVSQVLNAAAMSSAAQSASAPDAKYWRVESQWEQQSNSGIPEDSDSGPRIRWQGHTTKGVLYQDGMLRKMPVASWSMQQTSFSWDELVALTTSPKQLAKMLRDETAGLGRTPDHYMFKMIFELLGESPAPPELRSALWEVAAGLKGAVLSGQATDAIGRSGWRITLGEISYIVDASAGNILEYSTDMQTADVRTTFRSTILSAGPTDTAPTSIDDIVPPT